MRLFKLCRRIALLPLPSLALGVLFAAPALAENDGEFECTLDTFKGKYVISQQTFPDEEDGIHHVGATSAVLQPDGQGRIPYVRHFEKVGWGRYTSEINNDENAGTRTYTWTMWGETDPQELIDPAWAYTYKLEPDCTGQVIRTLPNGRVRLWWGFVLSNGGRDGTIHGGHGTAPILGPGTLQRIDNADQELEDRMARIEELLGSVARVLGIVPKKN